MENKVDKCTICYLPLTGGNCAWCGQEIPGQHYHSHLDERVKLCRGCRDTQVRKQVPRVGRASTKAEQLAQNTWFITNDIFSLPTDGKRLEK